MKKTLAMLGVSALALMGCDSRDANAQSQVSADVGNADSANMLIVEEGYEVVTPAASGKCGADRRQYERQRRGQHAG